MSIQIIDGFQVNAASPIDNRIVASGSVARNAIPYKYEGLRVFDISNNIPYVWINGTWSSENASGIAGSGTLYYFPIFNSSNVISNSLLYEYNGIIKTADNGNGDGLVQIVPEYGSVYAQGGFYGPATGITNMNANQITSGTLALNRLTSGSNGWILTGDSLGPTYINPAQITVGTASNALVSNTLKVTNDATVGDQYLTFVSNQGSPSFKINSTGLIYNPGTNTLKIRRASATSVVDDNIGKFSFQNGSNTQAGIESFQNAVGAGNNSDLRFYTSYDFSPQNTYVERMRIDREGRVGIGTTSSTINSKLEVAGGSLPNTIASKVNLLNFSTSTGASNKSWLEFSSVRNTTGSTWQSSGYRIQARVDANYQAYVQFNGTGNDYGISFGSGGTDATSNSFEKMRLNSFGNLGIGTTNPLAKFVVSNGGAQGMEMSYSAGLSSNVIESYNRSTGVPVNMTYYIGSGAGAEHIWYTNAINRMSITSGGYVKFNAEVYNKTTLASTRTLYIGSDYIIGGISSTRASKKNIENISDINWLYQLNAVTFNYRKKDKDDKYTEEIFEDLNYGLIAEDTQPVADFLINYDVRDDEKEMIGIEYSRLIVPILKAVQDQNAQIEELKLQVASLINKSNN